MQGEGDIFTCTVGPEGGKEMNRRPHPDAYFDQVSGHWYLYDANTGESKWLTSDDLSVGEKMTENPARFKNINMWNGSY